MSKEKTFEIGLVMAGAVSAGAYTAGVVDFLLEALRRYGKVRKKFAEAHPGQSLHNVQIRVVAGASAGGMTGTMLLSTMMDPHYRPMSGFDPADVTRPDIDANVFYRSWVDAAAGIDIRHLLDVSDITGRGALKALLNCERLDVIADSALARPRERQAYDYIPERIDHFLSVFNLSGVPYTLNFEGSQAQYGMVNHADMMHFVHDADPDATYGPNEIPLIEDPHSALDPAWKMLRQSTLATGAFPIALQARELTKDAAAYDAWKWWVPTGDKLGRCKDYGRCFSMSTIPPEGACRPEGEYRFVSVDGGVANNEPLEIARRALAGKDGFNPRGKNEANRAIVMVDPFPSEPCAEGFSLEGNNLFGVAARLVGSLKEQARFKPDELEAARNPEIFSRFLIAPHRQDAERGMELAGASLGAFGGFFSEKFRQHDFQLGRRNAQRFLMQHFVIGAQNPLVEDNLEWFRANGCVIEKEEETFVQIIPMTEEAGQTITKEIKPIDYAGVAMSEQELGEIMRLVDKRIERVIEKSYIIGTLIDELARKINFAPFRWLTKQLLGSLRGTIASFVVSKASDKIRTVVETDLKARGLL